MTLPPIPIPVPGDCSLTLSLREHFSAKVWKPGPVSTAAKIPCWERLGFCPSCLGPCSGPGKCSRLTRSHFSTRAHFEHSDWKGGLSRRRKQNHMTGSRETPERGTPTMVHQPWAAPPHMPAGPGSARPPSPRLPLSLLPPKPPIFPASPPTSPPPAGPCGALGFNTLPEEKRIPRSHYGLS